ncbi:translation initiation factor IF-2 isoform X2 [Procambarus clarkii]|uniref:translation initiation factor IF-2 isoform X2 n=1 Tax=Procambarus clarkii TaxID=6728 RepID=UPI003741EB2F
MKFWLVLALFGLVALTVCVHAEEQDASPEPESEPEPEVTPEPTPKDHEHDPSKDDAEGAAAEPTSEPAMVNVSSTVTPGAPSTEAQDSPGRSGSSVASLYLPALFSGALVALKLLH